MRKIIFTILSIILCSNAFSQMWVDLGVKGGYGLNYFVNSNIYNNKDFKYILKSGYSFGGKVGLNFADYHQVTFDVMTSSFNQGFTYNIVDTSGTSNSYEKSLGFNTVDFLLLYRNNMNGSYFEFGPQYSKVIKARGTNSFPDNTDGNVADNINKSYYGLVLGFGAFFVGTENTGLAFGFRFMYSLSDVINEQGKAINYPSATEYSSYKGSHPFSALIMLEFNHDLAYLAKRKCTSKKKIMFFN